MYYMVLSGIDITVQWNEKRPTRLPEGLDFVFTPVQQPAYKWWLNKIEELIDPLDVVTNGSQRLHGKNFYTARPGGTYILLEQPSSTGLQMMAQ